MELQYAYHALEIVSQAELITTEAETVELSAEWSVLSSSWLQAGIASYTSGGKPSSELEEMIKILITRLSVLLGEVVYYAFPLGGPLLLIRDALIIISHLPKEYEPGKVGDLNLTIVKRYNPTKIYGPYKYPNVPSEVWKAMQEAKGSFGSGAGQIFWNRYLHGFYNNYKKEHYANG